MLLVEGSCPTFSWGEVDDALEYELAIYGIGDDEWFDRLVVHETIPGSAPLVDTVPGPVPGASDTG